MDHTFISLLHTSVGCSITQCPKLGCMIGCMQGKLTRVTWAISWNLAINKKYICNIFISQVIQSLCQQPTGCSKLARNLTKNAAALSNIKVC